MKLQLGQTDIFFPVPAALVVSGTENECDVLTIAWIGMVSSTPPTIGISMDKKRFSLSLIRKYKQFTVNIPPSRLFGEVDYCGIASGSKTNKFADADLSLLPGTKTRVPIIEQCAFNMECVVKQEMELGDYVLILGEIVETHVDQDKVQIENGRPKLDVAKIDPLVYCATVREYWSLGTQLGNAFQAGKEILLRTKNDGRD